MPRKKLPPLAHERQQLVTSSIVTITHPDGRVEKLPAILGLEDPRVIAARAGGAKVKIHIKLGEPFD
jgi:hypothetical protein